MCGFNCLNYTMNCYDSVEYQYLPEPFIVLTLCGNWCPVNCSEKRKQIYKLFSIFILFLGILLFVEILIKTIATVGTNEFLLENLLTVIVFTVGLYKKINLLYSRQNIIAFINNYVDNEWYKPQSISEIDIYRKMKLKIRLDNVLFCIKKFIF
jgi:hypothetical protein